MKITVYGGAGVIGGNKIHVSFGDRGLFFDFGEPFDVSKKYCTEFIKPRGARGLRDYLRMGMLPALDCYRPDLYPGDLSSSDMTPVRTDALFLSHAHFDHYGHVGFLRQDIPIVASPMTYAILRAYSETGRANAPTELFDHMVRTEKDGEPRVLISPRGKVKEVKGRCWVLTGDVIEDDPEWKKGSVCDIIRGDGKINDIEYRAFPVDHSVYGATAYAVRYGNEDWVVYSGDLRMHGARGEMSAAFADAAGKLSPKALIIEGTRIGRVSEEKEITEAVVRENCRAAVEEGNGLTIADFSANNFERLDTFIGIAKDAGKRMVVTHRDVAFLESIAKVDGNVRKDDLWVYRSLSSEDIESVNGLKDKDWQVADPDDIAKDPEDYMLCFSFWDMTKLLDLDWSGGTYIYSNSEAYDLKQVDNLQKLMNWIDLFGFKCRGLDMVDGHLEFERGFHSSGHLSLPHLWQIIDTISPEVVIPVHCSDPEAFARSCPVETIVPVKGQPISLDRR